MFSYYAFKWEALKSMRELSLSREGSNFQGYSSENVKKIVDSAKLLKRIGGLDEKENALVDYITREIRIEA